MTQSVIPGVEPEPPRKEWKLIAMIFGVLLTLLAVPILIWQHHENNRPTLVEIRVVSATQGDPVFREGARVVEADEKVSLAIALKLEYPGKGSRWLSPVDQLELDGELIDHIQETSWPEPDRTARTFWFTLESPFLGGTLAGEDATEKLAARPFLAPEMGLGFLAQEEPTFHAADGVNLGNTRRPVNAGTYRAYARVEVVADKGSSRPLFSATSKGAGHFDDPALVRISRNLEPSFEGIHPSAGHLFRLPGFEPSPTSDWNPEEACNRLIATSSGTFAAMALTGSCQAEALGLTPLGTLTVAGPEITSNLEWLSDVRAGDILKQGDHWMVAVSDSGNGFLDGQDLVLHSRRRPPCLMPLAFALDEDATQVTVFRVEDQ